MGLQIWKPLMVLSIFLLSFQKIRVSADPQVPCLFFFGDSYFDNGNNNNLLTTAKANFLPYGIDFQNAGPTGRFTNDMNLADFTAKLLGFPNFIPSFAKATGQEILQGVNYASGFSGIRYETGRLNWVSVNPMHYQIGHHDAVIYQIRRLLGSRKSTEALLNKCIYNVNSGSSDYLSNYFMTEFYKTISSFTPEQYAEALTQELEHQLKTLYRKGARKFAVYGVGKIGCTPYARARFKTKGNACAGFINDATYLFDVRLRSLVTRLNVDLHDAKFTFINSTALLPAEDGGAGDLIRDSPCCEITYNRMLCEPQSTPCPNREKYVFYDAVNPTNATFYAAALQAYQTTSPDVAYPYSIKQLALL